jgi:hypothetical protein
MKLIDLIKPDTTTKQGRRLRLFGQVCGALAIVVILLNMLREHNFLR